ncbi:MAG: hypothetical protein Q4A79_02105 [Candidatus Saccharibacteria bacterium]|nr:hypothetical protein [Candidatus Saccharibacteria bacterium]
MSDDNNIANGRTVASANTQLGQNKPETPVNRPVQPSELNAQGVNGSASSSKENVLLGAAGAFVGSIIGVILIILLDRLGFVAAISGLAMAAGTIMLYEKFAKGLSGKGIAICVVIMILMTLLAENIAISIRVVEELASDYGVTASFGEIFGNLYELIAEGIIDGGAYAGSLALVYLFNIIGAVGVIKSLPSRKSIR